LLTKLPTSPPLSRYAKRNGDFVLVLFRSGSFEADGINELFEIV
jgi:hypothetical protein